MYTVIRPGGEQWRSVSSLEVSLLTPLDFVSSLSSSSSQQSKFNDRMLALTVAINHHHNNFCRKYNTSSWWTGGTDFKKESGRFSWERQDLTLSDAEELWVNGTFGPSSTTEGETGHQCVFIDHYQGVAITTFTLFQFQLEKFLMLNFQDEEEGMRLDAAPCQEELARPLCQYQHSSPHH